ncbi:MAG: hypothetical protein HUU01_17725 [Saprospiraceae bacterium]|nr:hypothetical protein [Saprospiraceae bacterium]
MKKLMIFMFDLEAFGRKPAKAAGQAQNGGNGQGSCDRKKQLSPDNKNNEFHGVANF